MNIISFDEFFLQDNNKNNIVKESTIKHKVSKINETAFVVNDNYKVKLTFDVPKSLVEEYINKVKEETGKTPLDFFNKNEIAEEIIQYLIKENLNIDNLPSSFTVGTEHTIEDETLDSDLDDIDDEFNIPEEDNDDEIEFDLEEDSDETGTIEIEDTDESDTEEGFETIEFDDNDQTINTVADYKKKANMVETTEEEEETIKPDEEYDIDDLYNKLGVKTNYYESIDLRLLKNNF